jgi:ABC-type phosphate transport system permease subunit
VIANEFGEATGIHTSALFAAGLVLFVLTLIVNIIARRFVVRGQHGHVGTGATGMTVAPVGDASG